MKENVNTETCMKAAIQLSKVSKETLVMFPLSRTLSKDRVKLTARFFDCFIHFNEKDKVDTAEFCTIGGSYIKVTNLDTDNPVVQDCTIKQGVE